MGSLMLTICSCIFLLLSVSHCKDFIGPRRSRDVKDAYGKFSGSGGSDDRKFKAINAKLDGLQSNFNQTLAEIQETMKSVRNLTLKTAEIENKMEILEEKVRQAENSLEPDQNYWNYSNDCGGILISQTGKIAYVELYRLSLAIIPTRSSCIWTIRANYRAKINVQLMTLQPVTVTEFLLQSDGTHRLKHTLVLTGRVYFFQGPVIVVVVEPMRSVSLTYSGTGANIKDSYIFSHKYLRGGNDSFEFSNEDATSSTDLIKSSQTRKIFSTVTTNVDYVNMLEVKAKLPQPCDNGSFHLVTSSENFNETREHESQCCKGGDCTVKRYSSNGWFFASRSSMLSPQPPKVNLVWTSISNRSDSYDKCGGLLMGRSGRISYKKYKSYLNNERCVWVIYPFPKSSIRIKEFSNGLETQYDSVTVWEVDGDVLRNTRLYSYASYQYRNFTGRVVIVTFYADSSVVKNGFDLTWEAVGPTDDSRDLSDEKIHHNSFKTVDTSSLTLYKTGFLVYVLANGEMDGSSLSISMNKANVRNCERSYMRIITSHGGLMHHLESTKIPICNTSLSQNWRANSSDGIGLVIMENMNSNAKVEVDLSWRFVPSEVMDSAGEVANCGGVLQGASGKITYKLETVYSNAERCIWLIHSPRSTSLKLTLAKDGFELCCDYIKVDTIDLETGLMSNKTKVITRANTTVTVQSNLAVVIFRSDFSVPGKGFILEFTGLGTRSVPSNHKLIHHDHSVGFYHFQRHDPEILGWWSEYDTEDTAPGSLFVIAYSTDEEPTADGTYGRGVFNVSMDDVQLGHNSHCQFDHLNFYEVAGTGDLRLAESYPKYECVSADEDTESCGTCVKTAAAKNDSSPHSFSSIYKAFVGIYKPVANPVKEDQSFSVHWDSSAGCGGVVSKGEGRIVYKLSSRYKNLEQCIWTVHIPHAKNISFLLWMNGFESCCDHIMLSSIDAQNGSISKTELLTAETKKATMPGPTVLVTFSSDASVTGDGFSLIFAAVNGSLSNGTTTNTSSYEEDDWWAESGESETGRNTTMTHYNFHNFHLRRRNSSFTFPFGELPALKKNDILTLAFSPEQMKNETFLRTGSLIRIKSLNMSVNPDNCATDSLRFYELISGQSDYNSSKYYEGKTIAGSQPGTCSRDGPWKCGNCLANETASEQLEVSTLYPAFVLVYKVVQDHPPGSKFRIDWSDRFRPPAEPRTTTYVPY